MPLTVTALPLRKSSNNGQNTTHETMCTSTTYQEIGPKTATVTWGSSTRKTLALDCHIVPNTAKPNPIKNVGYKQEGHRHQQKNRGSSQRLRRGLIFVGLTLVSVVGVLAVVRVVLGSCEGVVRVL